MQEKTVTITLDYPVTLPDKELTEVTMRRPLVKDLLKHNISENLAFKDVVALVADLCGLHPEDVALLDSADYEKLQKQLLRFRGIEQ